MSQLFEVLNVPFLKATELVPSPNTIPFSFQEVEVVNVIFKAMDYFRELFSCYIIHAVIFPIINYAKDDVTNIPTLTPICDFQVVALLFTPFVIVKAKYTVR